MTKPPLRAIDDVGLRLPKGMPEEIADPFIEYVATKAAALRGEAMALAPPDIAGDKWVRLRFSLDALKGIVFPQAERTIAEFAGAPAKIECRSGCCFCCYQNVDATIPEAIVIALGLTDPADPRVAAVLGAADAFKALDDDARIATARPCPLLVDRQCSVYEHRPLACRSLVSPDATRCHQAMASLEAGTGVLPIEIYVVLQFLCSGEQAAARGICRDLGLQDDIVELTQTVAAILRDPALVERWAAGEHVFAAR
jgi:hypothetical protein